MYRFFSSPLINTWCLTALLVTGCSAGYRSNPDSDYIAVQTIRAGAISTSLAWSPDGKWLASAGTSSLTSQGADRNDTVRVWDAATGKLEWSFQAHVGEKHKGRVMNVASGATWKPDGRYLATSGSETVKIWNVSTRKEEHVLGDEHGQGHSPQTIAWSQDGKYIASGSSNGDVVLWDVASREKVLVLQGHSKVITSVVWSPDGMTLASSSYDKTVRLWNVASGESIKELKGHTGFVQTVAWSPDGKKLASGGNDGTVRFWDVQSGTEAQSVHANAKPGGPQSPFPGIVFSLSWNVDGKTIAFGAADGTVRLIDVDSQNVKNILLGHYGEVMRVRWSPDGTRLASSDFNGTIIIWKSKE